MTPFPFHARVSLFLLAALSLPAQSQPAQPRAQTTAPKKAPRYFEGLGRTPEEVQQLEALSEAMKAYDEASRDFRREVQLLVEKKYEEKRSGLAGSYERAIRDLEVVERKERLEAIAQFEEFLRRYPNDATFTSNVMFRLAELYYELSSDEHLLAMKEYEDKLKSMEGTVPPEPKVNFERSIALYKRLLRDFPTYSLNDAVTYLKGYCHEKQADMEEALSAYRQLIAQFPASKFRTEAWVRIGEYYFDDYSQAEALKLAAQAYEEAIKDRQHPLFDKAIYKLGWTYYRMDQFDLAVDRFFALVDFYDAQSKAQGKQELGGDLRNEALQYAAISYADETWGTLGKLKDKFSALGSRSYEAEMYRRLGNVFFDQTRHADAIAAYRLALEKDPLAREAPQVQQRIVQALDRDRKMEEAFAEAAKLSNMFNPGSVWYEKHKSDVQLITETGELAEKSLYSSAIYHHQQALVFKQEQKFELAKSSFETAAQAYGTYLERFPRSRSAYEMQFYYAECLYNSAQFALAAKNYQLARDSSQDVKYQPEAAFSAALSWQKLLEQEVKQQRHAEFKVLKSTDRAEGSPPKSTELSSIEAQLIDDSDWFVSKFPKDARAPQVAYKAAEIYFAHDQFDEARRRFEVVVRDFPKTEVSQYATNLIVESYLITKDWKNVEEVSGRLASATASVEPNSELYRDLMKFKLGGRFNLASQLMEQGHFEEAATKYIELVAEEPKHEFADKALNNAAVCFEKSRRFESAMKAYERVYAEYPKSTLADGALFRVAVNAENSYDFDKAVFSYQKLVQDYPASKDRAAALYNSARLLEGQQRYDEAARAFLRYADLFPQAEDAAKNQFRAALIYEKQKSDAKAFQALGQFVKKYESTPAQSELVFDARRRMGDAARRLGRIGDAKKTYEGILGDFRQVKANPNEAPLAAEAAAQACFQLAEAELNAFDKLRIGGSGAALERSFTVKRSAAKKVTEAYGKCFAYKRLEWTLASLYRRGYVLERFAQTILEAPVPSEVKRLGEEAIAAYQDSLAQQTTVLEEKAVENYALTLTEARKNRLANEWTKKTIASLNRFRPKEYPMLKEAKSQWASQTLYPEGLLSTSSPVTAISKETP